MSVRLLISSLADEIVQNSLAVLYGLHTSCCCWWIQSVSSAEDLLTWIDKSAPREKYAKTHSKYAGDDDHHQFDANLTRIAVTVGKTNSTSLV